MPERQEQHADLDNEGNVLRKSVQPRHRSTLIPGGTTVSKSCFEPSLFRDATSPSSKVDAIQLHPLSWLSGNIGHRGLLGRDSDTSLDRIEHNRAVGLIGIIYGRLTGEGQGVVTGG